MAWIVGLSSMSRKHEAGQQAFNMTLENTMLKRLGGYDPAKQVINVYTYIYIYVYMCTYCKYICYIMLARRQEI